MGLTYAWFFIRGELIPADTWTAIAPLGICTDLFTVRWHMILKVHRGRKCLSTRREIIPKRWGWSNLTICLTKEIMSCYQICKQFSMLRKTVAASRRIKLARGREDFIAYFPVQWTVLRINEWRFRPVRKSYWSSKFVPIHDMALETFNAEGRELKEGLNYPGAARL